MTWKPKEGICIDYNRSIFAPVVPKSACTTLRSGVFYFDYGRNHGKQPRGEFTPDKANIVPIDFDCMLFIREPLDRLISGIAEVICRTLPNAGYMSLGEDGIPVGAPNYQDSKDIEDYFLDFLKYDLQGLFDLSTDKELNIHLQRQTDIIDWPNLTSRFKNVTIFEVDRNLWSNVAHWLNERNTPSKSNSANQHGNPGFKDAYKSYLKGMYSLALRDNKNNLLDDYKDYFKTDINFYNSHKAEFYRGAEQ